MKARPAGISQSDWRDFALVAVEINTDRAVSAARIKKAIAIGKSVKDGAPAKMVQSMESAYEKALLAEATPSGKKALAEQAPVAFGKAKPVMKAGPAPAAVAAKAPGVAKPSKPVIAQPSKPGIAQPTKPGIAKPTRPAVAATGEEAAYAKIADAVKSNKGKTFTYGKLNFAYEIARKKNDPVAANIARDMREMRPLAPGPGRYGVSDKEYTNYAMVVAAITGGKDAPAAAMKTAAETAKKFGHTEVALSITDKLPSAPAKAKAPTPVVASKGPAKSPMAKTVAKAAPVAAATAAAATVTLHKPGQAVTGPEAYRGVPKSVWAKLPPPPSGVSADDWRTYAMVHYFLGTKNTMPTIEEIRTAATIAAKVGKPQRAKIYTALTIGQTIPSMIAGRTAALATKPPSKYAAEIIGNSIIAQAAHSEDPKVLKLAADIAKQQGHAKTYTALLARIPKDAPAAGATAVAAKKDLLKGKIVAGKTGKPGGVTDSEWTFFTTTINAVNSKRTVALADIERAKAIADRIHYDQTSVQLARATADIRHKEAVAVKNGAPAAAPAPAPAKGGGPSAATVAKVALPVAAVAAATGVVAAKAASKPAPAPVSPSDLPPPAPAMVPADTVAEVPYVPSKKVVDTAAKATGVPPVAVAEKLQEARNDTGNARAEVAQGADLNRRLASRDEQTVSVAREELRGIQTQKEAGDPVAKEKLAALGAAAASATAAAAAMKSSEAPKVATKEEAFKVDAPQASIAGKPESSGIAATVVAALGLAGMGVIALSRRKKRG